MFTTIVTLVVILGDKKKMVVLWFSHEKCITFVCWQDMGFKILSKLLPDKCLKNKNKKKNPLMVIINEFKEVT